MFWELLALRGPRRSSTRAALSRSASRAPSRILLQTRQVCRTSASTRDRSTLPSMRCSAWMQARSVSEKGHRSSTKAASPGLQAPVGERWRRLTDANPHQSSVAVLASHVASHRSIRHHATKAARADAPPILNRSFRRASTRLTPRSPLLIPRCRDRDPGGPPFQRRFMDSTKS